MRCAAYILFFSASDVSCLFKLLRVACGYHCCHVSHRRSRQNYLDRFRSALRILTTTSKFQFLQPVVLFSSGGLQLWHKGSCAPTDLRPFGVCEVAEQIERLTPTPRFPFDVAKIVPARISARSPLRLSRGAEANEMFFILSLLPFDSVEVVSAWPFVQLTLFVPGGPLSRMLAPQPVRNVDRTFTVSSTKLLSCNRRNKQRHARQTWYHELNRQPTNCLLSFGAASVEYIVTKRWLHPFTHMYISETMRLSCELLFLSTPFRAQNAHFFLLF